MPRAGRFCVPPGRSGARKYRRIVSQPKDGSLLETIALSRILRDDVCISGSTSLSSPAFRLPEVEDITLHMLCEYFMLVARRVS